MFDNLISDGWQFCGYREDCPIFRRIENGRGKWCAIVGGEVLPITYDQARGFDAITDIGKLSRFLGARLLP